MGRASFSAFPTTFQHGVVAFVRQLRCRATSATVFPRALRKATPSKGSGPTGGASFKLVGWLATLVMSDGDRAANRAASGPRPR